MRQQDKQWNAGNSKDIFGADLYRSGDLEGHASHLEIAEELGVSIGEVRKLKKKLDRS